MTKDFSTLQPFASSKHFKFTSDQLSKYGFFSGDYRNHHFKIEPFLNYNTFSYGFRIFVSVDRELNDSLQRRSNRTGEQAPVKDVINPLIPSSSRYILQNTNLKGTVTAATIDQKLCLIYKQNDTKMTSAYLNRLANLLVDFADAYFDAVKVGTEAIPFLKDMIIYSHHWSIASVLLKEIARTSSAQFSDRSSHVFCHSCLARYKAYKWDPPWLGTSITYYGCRICSQSQKFFEGIIAILDNRKDDERSECDGILRVNWLKRHSLFDFDEVEIIRASDEDVERFAVQVGNDNDSVRRPLYQKMRCTVAFDCELTENTLRVLRSMFGNVEVKSKLILCWQLLACMHIASFQIF